MAFTDNGTTRAEVVDRSVGLVYIIYFDCGIIYNVYCMHWPTLLLMLLLHSLTCVHT